MPKGMATGSVKNPLKRPPGELDARWHKSRSCFITSQAYKNLLAPIQPLCAGPSPALRRSPAAAAAQCGPSAIMAHPQPSQPLTAAEPIVPAEKSRGAVESMLPAEILQPPAEQFGGSLVAEAAPAIQSQPSQSAGDRQQPADGCAQALASAAPKVDAHRSCAKRQTGQAHDPAVHARPRKRSKGGAREQVPAQEPEPGRPKSRMQCERKRRSGSALGSKLVSFLTVTSVPSKLQSQAAWAPMAVIAWVPHLVLITASTLCAGAERIWHRSPVQPSRSRQAGSRNSPRHQWFSRDKAARATSGLRAAIPGTCLIKNG